MLTGTQLPTFEIWLSKVLLDQPTEITVYVLEVLEDANKVVYGIFKPGERAFSLGLSVSLRVAVDGFQVVNGQWMKQSKGVLCLRGVCVYLYVCGGLALQQEMCSRFSQIESQLMLRCYIVETQDIEAEKLCT